MKKTYVSIVWGTERTRHIRFVSWKKAILLASSSSPLRKRKAEKKSIAA